MNIPKLSGAALLFAVLLAGILTLVMTVWGRNDAHAMLLNADMEALEAQNWLSKPEEDDCLKTPCLTIRHDADAVTVRLTTFETEVEEREDLLETRILLTRPNDGLALVAGHDPPHRLREQMRRNGVDMESFRREQILYGVAGQYSWRESTIELPYGVLAQFFYDGFQEAYRAAGLDGDLERLQTQAEIAATQISSRFGLASLGTRTRIAMIVAGPTQTLTYAIAALAIALTTLEGRRSELRPYSDGVADLIPFTGFFGTLIGVAGGLQILGLSDVTDDVSKALSLGKIGSNLGMAINTTILAIVIFGLVLIFQYALRLARDGLIPARETSESAALSRLPDP